MRLSEFLPRQPWDFGDYLIMGIMGIILLFIGFLLFMLLAWIAKMLLYEFSYAVPKDYKGEVVDMQYTPSRTRVTSAGKTTTVHTDPEKNVVIIKTELEQRRIDSSLLYQRVRIGEEATVRSQAEYSKPKFWEGEWKYEGERLLSVTSVKGQEVRFDSEKPANYRRL